MFRRTLWWLCLVWCVIFASVSIGIGDGRKVSGGSRKTSWGRPNSGNKPKPNNNYGQNNQEHTRLTYGHNEPSSGTVNRQSAPVLEHNPYQPSAPKLPGHDNTGTIHKDVGWNTNSAPNPGWNVNNQQNRPGNIGWNVNQNQPHAGAPPPYPGHGQPHSNAGAPPPYPGYGQPHSNAGAPPPYPGQPHYPSNVGPPPAYPGHYPNQPHYPSYQPGHQNYPQPGYGSHPGGYGGQPGGYGGFPGGGGFGGFPVGGYGGFPGGGGFGHGYGSPSYGGHSGGRGNTLLAAGAGVLGGAVLGAALYSLASDHNNHHVYYPNQPRYTNRDGSVSTSYVPQQGSFADQVGNVMCVSTYNARAVSHWANSTLKDFYQSFPPNSFTQNGTNAPNFTVIPGEIIHNEPLEVTCCGTEHGPIKIADLASGKPPGVNCVHEIFSMPFKKLRFVPINVTATNTTSPNATAPINSMMSDQPQTNLTNVPGNYQSPVNVTTVPVVSDENKSATNNSTNTETTTTSTISPTTIKT